MRFGSLMRRCQQRQDKGANLLNSAIVKTHSSGALNQRDHATASFGYIART